MLVASSMTPERPRPGGCTGRLSHSARSFISASHCSSESTCASIKLASSSVSAQAPALVRTPAAAARSSCADLSFAPFTTVSSKRPSLRNLA
eukprot:213452-Chlamydomonas_euryale.AAC.15